MNSRATATALYGGTFDPIHIGHLRSAIEIRDVLGVDELRLVPASEPPHRDTPGASAEQRLHMLRLAVQKVPGLLVDDREIRREGPSYSMLTLKEVRDELPGDAPLYFIMGMDAFELLDTWHEWRALTDLAHIVILARPGADRAQIPAPVLEWLSTREVSTIDEARGPAGSVVRVTLTQLDISASSIRQKCRSRQPIDFLVPEAVQAYIHDHALYQ